MKEKDKERRAQRVKPIEERKKKTAETTIGPWNVRGIITYQYLRKDRKRNENDVWPTMKNRDSINFKWKELSGCR